MRPGHKIFSRRYAFFFYKNQEISVQARCSKYFGDLSLYVLNFVLKLFLINIENTCWSSMFLNFTFCHYFYEAGVVQSLILSRNKIIQILKRFRYLSKKNIAWSLWRHKFTKRTSECGKRKEKNCLKYFRKHNPPMTSFICENRIVVDMGWFYSGVL